MRKFLTFFLLLLTCAAWTQQMSHRLNNQDIIDMVTLGLSDEIIIAKIHSARKPEDLAFDTSPHGLAALKAANVSEAVLKVMIGPAPSNVGAAPASGTAVAPANATALAPASATGVAAASPTAVASIANDSSLPPAEVGVYWKDGYSFVRFESEMVSQAKVGGRAGSMFTYGMRSQHWDAYVNGPTSKNRVYERRPLFYFYVPDGGSASDFILIKLQKKGDRREFQVGSFGGITGGKSGVKRDKEVPYRADHVAIRTYRVTLDEDLQPGEYAFFMGTGQQAMMASGRGGSKSGGSASGRIYDFTVPD